MMRQTHTLKKELEPESWEECLKQWGTHLKEDDPLDPVVFQLVKYAVPRHRTDLMDLVPESYYRLGLETFKILNCMRMARVSL